MVIVNHQGTPHFYYGDYKKVESETAGDVDPTALPIVKAIQHACAGYKELTGAPFVFHLPEDTQIISRDKPHPMSLVAADWARIGRKRGADANDPEQDGKDKDKTRILYLADTFEHMHVRDKGNHVGEVNAQEIWKGIQSSSAKHVKIPETPEKLSYAHRQWNRFIQGFASEKPATVAKY